MSLRTFTTVLHKIPKSMDVMFCGMSEPFQNPQCTEMVLQAHASGHKVIIFTTLIGLSLKNAKLLFETIPFNGKKSDFLVHLASAGDLEHIVVDKQYEEVLTYVSRLDRNITFLYHGSALHPRVKQIMDTSKFRMYHAPPHNRAGHLGAAWLFAPERKRGKIGCSCWGFIVLPDGSVTLCTNDYGLKYYLGNILHSSYEELNSSKTVKFIQKAFNDESVETLCRYCANSYNKDTAAKFYNTPPSLNKIPLGVKLYLHDHHYKTFTFMRRMKRSFKKKINIKK
jgi:radical SAM protein with 4Fe4S-binding SPASM domain